MYGFILYSAFTLHCFPKHGFIMKQRSINGTVLVTGAAGSLGAALSIELIKAGFNTVMLDSNERALETTWDAIVKSGLPEPILHPFDLAVASPEKFEELVNALESEFGGLDGLIHCAARFDGLTPLDQVSPYEWLQQMQVNLNSAWLLSVACLPMLRRGQSSFLYFILEDLHKMQAAYWGAYGVSKHALKALVHQFAAESKSTGLQVLGINPGAMASRIRAAAYHSENPSKVSNSVDAAQKILRLVSGETIPAEVILDLT